ncbi:acidic fibroblast growth factor intracellular-binding protein-like isoform X2 [Ptychodera flava]|uniref:acidic fibroblast growth factor intracellular-binding protein-like isoform X2 n=1 Tax=Ptychodera flava TaxID=63121 RepID=UPI00396A5C4E
MYTWGISSAGILAPANMSDINVFVGNTSYIDPEVYQLWLDGLSATDAVYARQHTGILRKTGATRDMLQYDTLDYYRTFSMLEKILHHPPQIANQMLLQIPPSTQKMLIEKYYEFDFPVLREILGKKLSSKNRKDLDDISEKTSIKLKSCRRQFDNFKRVFKVVEDMEGPIVKNIQSHFLISERLAKQYAAIVFFANNRFDTGKKRLQYLTVPDFTHCADEMIANWTVGSIDSKVDIDADIDRDFLQELRDTKILLDKDISDIHRNVVCSALQDKMSEKVYVDMESNFKIIDPCRQTGWTSENVRNFLEIYKTSCKQIEVFKRQPRLLRIWERYMDTLTRCILRMYHS